MDSNLPYEFFLTDSLEKVFPEQKPRKLESRNFTLLKGESFNFQLVHFYDFKDSYNPLDFTISIAADTALKENTKIYETQLVPVDLAAYLDRVDTDYLFTEPRLAPDLLLELENNIFRPYAKQYRSLWIALKVPEDLAAGKYEYKLLIKHEGKVVHEESLTLEILASTLAKQEIKHTEWFHTDCLADYYQVEVFSEKHWQIIGNFMQALVNVGANMILTPIFTPPLDTKVGGERTTVQLLDISIENKPQDLGEAKYKFNFKKLERWLNLALGKGITYFEMPPLFTQWGAKACPKVIVNVNGKNEKLFSWDTKATSKAYKNFLEQLLPALIDFLKDKGLLEKTYFHISDEPNQDNLEDYKAAQSLVLPYLKDLHLIDALSNYEFYEKGLVKTPVVATDHLKDFKEHKVSNYWVYYCCAQAQDVSNRFISMPSSRNRILGLQLYLDDIKGFLHWGFNFYNAQFSRYNLNPFVKLDAYNAFPAGDPFLVYPAKDGKALYSLRALVLKEAFEDIRKLRTLENLSSRAEVEALIKKHFKEEITFKNYPKGEDAYKKLLSFDKKVKDAIKTHLET